MASAAVQDELLVLVEERLALCGVDEGDLGLAAELDVRREAGSAGPDDAPLGDGVAHALRLPSAAMTRSVTRETRRSISSSDTSATALDAERKGGRP